MKYVEVVADAGSADTIEAIASKVDAVDFRLGIVDADNRQMMRLLIDDDQLQHTLDTLQTILGAQPTSRIIVLPVETSLPKPEEKEEHRDKNKRSTSRESLYEEVAKGAKLDNNFVLLVILSTVVAAIGLLENNVAVIIGAMVIAPLLGPNLALSLGTALGDPELMKRSALTLTTGITIAVLFSVSIGFFWNDDLNSTELIARTDASLDSIVLALASGAAAALSLTTGLSGVLVGVMVAVALLPPAVTLGLMLGHGDFGSATGAGFLLLVNIVCVNLASKLMFLIRGVTPRTWYEKENARRAMIRYIFAWLVTLSVLIGIIFLR